MNAPCRGCEERMTLCHSSCERYKRFKEMTDEVKLHRKYESDLVGANIEGVKRVIKTNKFKPKRKG